LGAESLVEGFEKNNIPKFEFPKRREPMPAKHVTIIDRRSEDFEVDFRIDNIPILGVIDYKIEHQTEDLPRITFTILALKVDAAIQINVLENE